MFNWSGRTQPFKDAEGQAVAGSVAEAGFWRIGGVDQWVMIRGRSVENPLLIILHGGPDLRRRHSSELSTPRSNKHLPSSIGTSAAPVGPSAAQFQPVR